MEKYQRIESSEAVFGEMVEVNENLTQAKLLKDEEWSNSDNVEVQWLNEQGEIIEDEEMVDKLEKLYFEEKIKSDEESEGQA
jgi:hypothetical protein